MKHLFFLGVCMLLPMVSALAGPQRSLSATEFADSGTARALDRDVAAIERSEPQGWRDLASYAYHVDGEHGEAFSAACSYLARRDPTVFLRRYLAGDPDALFCGWAAYRWSREYRTVLDTVYRYRLLEARSTSERRLIQRFITFTHDLNHLPPRPNHTLQRTEAGHRVGSDSSLDLASLCR